MPKMMPDVFSSSAIHRYNNGVPVLTKNDIPYPAECIKGLFLTSKCFPSSLKAIPTTI